MTLCQCIDAIDAGRQCQLDILVKYKPLTRASLTRSEPADSIFLYNLLQVINIPLVLVICSGAQYRH